MGDEQAISAGPRAHSPRLPNFVVIGAMKAATTSLYHYLRAHPQIHMPDKEPHFFVSIGTGTWNRGLDWYRELFAGHGGARAVGEASTAYSAYPLSGDVAGRMARVLPEARLVYMLREPVARMRSQYVQLLCTGLEHRPIHEALLNDTRYLYPSLYALQLERYLRHFSRDQILVLRSEDLDAEPRATLARVLRFLDVDESFAPENLGERYNPSVSKRAPRRWARWSGSLMVRSGFEMRLPVRVESWLARTAYRDLEPSETTVSEELREALDAIVRPDTARLASLVGDDFVSWG